MRNGWRIVNQRPTRWKMGARGGGKLWEEARRSEVASRVPKKTDRFKDKEIKHTSILNFFTGSFHISLLFRTLSLSMSGFNCKVTNYFHLLDAVGNISLPQAMSIRVWHLPMLWFFRSIRNISLNYFTYLFKYLFLLIPQGGEGVQKKTNRTTKQNWKWGKDQKIALNYSFQTSWKV